MYKLLSMLKKLLKKLLYVNINDIILSEPIYDITEDDYRELMNKINKMKEE